MGLLLFEIAFDVISLFLVMMLVADHDKTHSKWSRAQWLFAISGFILVNQTMVLVKGSNIQVIPPTAIDFLPVNGIEGVLGLLFLTLLMNSIVLKVTNVEVVFTTMVGFIIWLLLRLFALGLVDVFSISQWFIRPFTLLLTICFYWLIQKKFINYLRHDYNQFVQLIITIVFSFLLYITLHAGNQSERIIQPVFIIFVVIILFAIVGWLLYEQKKTQVMENRMKAVESYMPIIDELVAEVRSRQHEFSNKLLAISSILDSTEKVEDAQRQISKYIENVQLSSGQYELLNMDDKVIAGFLYTKMKRAEQLNRRLEIERSVSVSAIPCEEHDLIEVLGILIDNAIEACYGGDSIKVSMRHVNNHYEITVTNPADYKSNEEFIQLFHLGYSTKSTFTTARGFGLYNVQQVAKQYNGKIIARNEHNEKMITIGIQF